MTGTPQEIQQMVLDALAQAGAVHTDSHFVLASGRHGDAFINVPKAACKASALMAACKPIGEHFANRGVEAVVGPAEGGLTVAFCVALWLEQLNDEGQPDVRNVRASKAVGPDEKETFELKRGMLDEVAGKKCLVVDDIGTTGKSIIQTITAVEAAGGEVVWAAYVCIRGEDLTAQKLSVLDLYTPARLILPSWSPEECAIGGPCAWGRPIRTDLGHGAKYLAELAKKQA